MKRCMLNMKLPLLLRPNLLLFGMSLPSDLARLSFLTYVYIHIYIYSLYIYIYYQGSLSLTSSWGFKNKNHLLNTEVAARSYVQSCCKQLEYQSMIRLIDRGPAPR